MTRPIVAYLSCSGTMPRSPHRREDAFEHDLAIGVLGLGLHHAGRSIEPVQWDAPHAGWDRYEAAVVGTTWDYAQRPDAFAAALQRIAGEVPLYNPCGTLLWNAHKRYLLDLEARGCATVPTLWLDHVDEAACRAAFDTLEATRLVIKPQVGAGAWRQVMLARGDAWPDAAQLPPGAAMVQPFMPAIVSEGEYSFLFFNRRYSHAVRKRAAPGDYRIQSSFGGQDEPVVPSSSDIAAAEQVLDAVAGPLLYARVDMVRDNVGMLRLMELELIEPFLYPLHEPAMGHRFADAYMALINGDARV